MTILFSRRALLAGLAGAWMTAADPVAEIADIERRLGGRLGVAALDTGSGRRIEHRATAFARSIGDTVTRLDRNEPALNRVPAGDRRDTTSPASMVQNLRTLLLETKALSESSRGLLTKWLVENTTGNDRLRAGLPKAW